MRFILPLAAVGILLLASCGTRQMDGDTLARIGDKSITRAMLEEEINRIPPYQRENFTTLEGRRALLEHMIERELLILAAYDAGLDTDSTVLLRVENASQQIKDVMKRSLIQAYYEEFVVKAVTISEDEIQAYYAEQADDMFHQDSQVRASHVLVSTAEGADEVQAMIEEGIPFDSIVADRSEHLATVSVSGDLGWITIGSPMPYLGEQIEISDALFLADQDDVIGPFETEIGYHWFKVTDTQAEGSIPLEDVRSNIENMLLPARVNSYFKDELIPALYEDYSVMVQNVEDSPVLATIGDFEITREMLDAELQMIPPYQRANFETADGQELLLSHIIERELLFQAAQDSGLEEDSIVVAQMRLAELEVDQTRDMTMVQLYYDRHVVEAVVVPEADIVAYYQEHADDIYYQDPQLRIAHILAGNEAGLLEAAALIEAGQPFDSVAMTHSIHEPTASIGGDLGWVNVNSPLPYILDSGELVRQLYGSELNTLIGPRETDLGFHLFWISEKVEEGSRPLEEVRESIIDALRSGLVNTYLRETVFPALREEYGVEVNEEAFLPDQSVPADSLMQMAQELMGTDPLAAIQYFELFLERFPRHEKADQAQFLIGFTYSEQLGDYEAARGAFSSMITAYPESELADDAQWMIENMETPIEDFLPNEELQAEPVTQ
jgi:peptidyl-prolyl cis-trans isomerase C